MTVPTYLALDIGHKRIGLAVGNEFVFGRGTYELDSPESFLTYLRDLIAREHITAFVVGLPYVPSGDKTASYQLAEEWAERLKVAFGFPVYTVNESHSSVEAERLLREEGVDILQHKEKIDERAAILLLEQFLHEAPSA